MISNEDDAPQEVDTIAQQKLDALMQFSIVEETASLPNEGPNTPTKDVQPVFRLFGRTATPKSIDIAAPVCQLVAAPIERVKYELTEEEESLIRKRVDMAVISAKSIKKQSKLPMLTKKSEVVHYKGILERQMTKKGKKKKVAAGQLKMQEVFVPVEMVNKPKKTRRGIRKKRIQFKQDINHGGSSGFRTPFNQNPGFFKPRAFTPHSSRGMSRPARGVAFGRSFRPYTRQ